MANSISDLEKQGKFSSGEAEVEVEAGIDDVKTNGLDREEYDPHTGVKRGLKTRHISMMAIAGIIGPGLFIGIGRGLALCGPAALIIGFFIVGCMGLIMMFSIGELNTLYDFNFNTHAEKWVDPAFGATVGWYYVILWICNVIQEYVSFTNILTFYTDVVPIWGWFLIFWFVFTLYQQLGVEAFGEAEYVLALTKLVFITAFYVFAIIYAAGGIKGRSPGNPFKETPFADGFKSILNSFVYAGVYMSGIESISLTVSESKNPRRAIPLAVKQTMFRILFVYFGICISYGITVPYDHPALSSENRTMKSPMTIAFTDAGWANAGYYVSTVVVITCFSSINCAIYLASRSLYNLSHEGYAPKIFQTHNKSGVPYVAIHTVHLFSFLNLLTLSGSGAKVYAYMVNISGVCTFIVWSAICFTHIRFRKGWLKQGHTLAELPYIAPFFPYLTYAALAVGIILMLVQGWSCFDPWSAPDFVDMYILLPLFPVFYYGYKYYFKTKYISYEDMDFETGKRFTGEQVEMLKIQDQNEKKKPLFHRMTHIFS
ncbi:uncharacterized protein ASCRUDRAFT_76612 [Ascoidea rubescens DSM 1968]|uniref:Amino acid permease/ SLC12A domain-containing protein n=1 Tax=Ascoidea rubescens DSM 1968 TaxID=1344418 RepID=A0A1D2VEM7_9ASCO|nr:hypothetical protein ASCRUDRAFT_76612 [Ascoidea rubescens DSM 1968]ODV60101.1 hypothetical protein ASCRUDRAFT_76612 [Ascoidea rubescens DSM 1968]